MATQTRQKTPQKIISVKFSEKEATFLMENKLARIGTVSAKGQPHVVPIVYEFDGSYLYFSGWNLTGSLMYKQISHNNKVAMVIDENPGSPTPWDARGVEIRGVAEITQCHNSTYVRVTPLKSVSWGL